MIKLSLGLNLAVLIPICTALAIGNDRMSRVYGESTQARGILLSVYVAIALLSLVLLIWPDRRMTAALLLVQIAYKVTTPLTVGTLANPIVISNLAIAALHTATLFVIVRAERAPA